MDGGKHPLTRRAALALGAAAPLRRALARETPLQPASGAAATWQPALARAGQAKSVIQIWMWGGPSHLDTFDPKPEAGAEYCGPLTNPIPAKADGVRIGELLPLLAQQAHRYSLIRGMTHGINAHETASYAVQSGRAPGGRDVYPSLGAAISYFKGYRAGYRGLIPPYVVLTEPQGRFSEAGFLGARFRPFATGGNPAQVRFAVEGIVAQGITDERQKARRDLLGRMNTLEKALAGDPQLAAYREAGDQAYDLILGDAGRVFDLAQEKDEVRDRYGRNTFGQSCLAARRLVEKGVPHVTINYKGWDTHKQHFQTMRRMLPEMDKGLSSLLDDLAARGLLETTVIWWSGEFGRTPRVQWEAPWNGGRGHYGNVFSALVAGGGFRGGLVVGESDAKGEEVRDRPVYPVDVLESIYALLGLDPNATLPHPMGEKARLLPAAGEVPRGGFLKELL